MRHIIGVLVENKFGVLARISGLFSARGFNIESLAVGETENPSISRMTIVVGGDEKILEQVMKQLHKLIDVITVYDLTKKDFIDRELMLVKVKFENDAAKHQIIEIVDSLKAEVLEVKDDYVIVEMVGDQEKAASLLELLKPFGIKELARTGRIAIAK